MQIKKLKVKDKWNRDFGILTYDVKKDTFHFKYDDDCEGYDFSDINVKLEENLSKIQYLMYFHLMRVMQEVK